MGGWEGVQRAVCLGGGARACGGTGGRSRKRATSLVGGVEGEDTGIIYRNHPSCKVTAALCSHARGRGCARMEGGGGGRVQFAWE